MKNETARREIESLDYYLQNHTNDYSEESHTAMMMAIDALSHSEIPNTCGDAISRQAVLKIIDGWYDNNRDTENIEDLIVLITYMSSVSPQQRAGRWIEHFDEIGKWYECDQCHTDWGGAVNYCPNCGCKM